MTEHATFAAARTVAFDQIPVVDIAPLLNGDDAARRAVGRLLRRAASEVGFFYISRHGIPATLRERALAVAERFFLLDVEAKAGIAVGTDQRGWMATGMALMPGAAAHDLKEVFFWGREVAADDPQLLAGRPLIARNKWPDAVLPELRRELLPYYRAVCTLGGHLLQALATAFDLPADFFDRAYRAPLARGQLVYYPVSDATQERHRHYGVSPHTDFGVLTLLLQDDNGGLQVRNRAGDWIAAPPIPDTLICNIGDLLQRWSNDRLQSTVHGVINRSGRRRFSIPVFFDPNTDAWIDPADLNLPPGEAPRYPPVRAGEYIVSRNRIAFSQYRDNPGTPDGSDSAVDPR